MHVSSSQNYNNFGRFTCLGARVNYMKRSSIFLPKWNLFSTTRYSSQTCTWNIHQCSFFEHSTWDIVCFSQFLWLLNSPGTRFKANEPVFTFTQTALLTFWPGRASIRSWLDTVAYSKHFVRITNREEAFSFR